VHGVTAPAIVLLKTFDNKKDIFSGSFTKEDILAFINENSIPLVDNIGPDNYEMYMKRNLPIAYFFTASSDDDKKVFESTLQTLGEQYKGKMSFVYIDAVKVSFSNTRYYQLTLVRGSRC
jgi:protein disulfide-isomerase A1